MEWGTILLALYLATAFMFFRRSLGVPADVSWVANWTSSIMVGLCWPLILLGAIVSVWARGR